MQKTALIAGASGLIGSYCLQYLLESDRYNIVYAVVRNPLKMAHPKLKEIIANGENLSETLKVLFADDVYCCIGSTIKKAGSQEAFRKVDFDYIINLAKAMQLNGAKQFLVVSSVGANAASGNFYLRTKGEMEQALKNIHIPRIVVLRPSVLLGPRNEFRLGEIIGKKIMQLINFAFIGKLKRYKAIHGKKVAQVMLQEALKGEPGFFIIESENLH
jgi:uncharacterized protein YbjT (DUF2867 family)